jgi:GNAT superfamily N-acetyltransferase
MLEEDMADLQKFMPPDGRLLLAAYEQETAGCICLKRLVRNVGEFKRLYVRPAHRRKGVGQALASALVGEARQIGYATLRLDSARFMTGAHVLYRSLGFADIAPYAESEIPAEYHAHWVFMEKSLA